MPKSDELSKQSPEQVKALSKVVKDLKTIEDAQDKNIQNVLAGEEEIGKKRLSYLEEYFDTYSRKLDEISTKQKAVVDTTFKTLNTRLTTSYTSLSKKLDQLESRIFEFSKQGDSASPASDSKSKKTAAKQGASDVAASKIVGQIDYSAKLDRIIELLAGGAADGGKGSSTPSVTPPAPPTPPTAPAGTGDSESHDEEVKTVVGDGKKKKMKETAPTTAVDELKKLNQIGEVTRKKITKAWEAARGGSEEAIAALKKELEGQFGEQKVSLLIGHLDDLAEAREAHANVVAEKEAALLKTQVELEMAQSHEKMKIDDRLAEYRIKKHQEALDAQTKALKKHNDLRDEIEFFRETERRKELAKIMAKEWVAEDKEKSDDRRSEQLNNLRATLEEDAKLQLAREKARLRQEQKENGTFYSDKEIEEKLAEKAEELALGITEKLNKEFNKENDTNKRNKKEQKHNKNVAKQELLTTEVENQKKGKRAEALAYTNQAIEDLTGQGHTIKERRLALYNMTHDENGATSFGHQFAAAVNILGSLAKKLEKTVDSIASYKSTIDTRLQGSNNEKRVGSYWDQLTTDIMRTGAVTPFFKQEKFAENVKTLVESGIAYDLKQRAFLMTIQEKIANTFNVADSTLLRIVRIQQADTTAARLGMESALNAFLNNMYENTEYLKGVAESVRGSLQEMESLMGAKAATEVEFQVQKWMGSLYSVGMSQEAVNSIATALGQVAAGQIEALTGGNGTGNLMVMAANKAGIPIADILAKGLDSSQTNTLLQATVNYLAELADVSKDSRVVQQQLAGVFGVKASDLQAAVNLAKDDTVSTVASTEFSYSNMLGQLYKMAGSMGARTSIGEMMTNVWDNVQYSLSAGMANNPITYLTYKLASLLESTTGGIDIGLPMVMGNGLPVQFKVSDLMRALSMAGGVVGSFGALVSGLANSTSGKLMLQSMGIDKGSGLSVTPRGQINILGALDNEGGGDQTTSGSGYVGNANGSDIVDSTVQKNEDDVKEQVITAVEEAEATAVDYINTNVLKIYELLDEVTNGKRSFNVKVSGYGLTSLVGGSTSTASPTGSVSPGSGSNNSTNSNINDNGFSSGSTTSGDGSIFNNGSATFGGWTMT